MKKIVSVLMATVLVVSCVLFLSACDSKESETCWLIAFYVDEFNNVTDKPYLTSGILYGTFSNSVVTNDELKSKIFIDKQGVAIKLWAHSVVKAFVHTNFSITLLDDEGNKYYTEGEMFENGDRIYLKNPEVFINLLTRNSKVKMYIEEDSAAGINRTYLFTVESGDFNSMMINFYESFLK